MQPNSEVVCNLANFCTFSPSQFFEAYVPPNFYSHYHAPIAYLVPRHMAVS